MMWRRNNGEIRGARKGTCALFPTIRHLLVYCVLSRQIWALTFQHLSLPTLAPTISDSCFSSWCRKAISSVPKDMRKGLNSLIIFVTSEIWKHRNSCVFLKVQGAYYSESDSHSDGECSLWWGKSSGVLLALADYMVGFGHVFFFCCCLARLK